MLKYQIRMLKKRTTFILGAGASCDFKFPTGDGLQQEIVKCLEIDPSRGDFKNDEIRSIVNILSYSNGSYEKKRLFVCAARKISDGMPLLHL